MNPRSRRKPLGLAIVILTLSVAPAAEATNGYFTHGYGTQSKALAGAGVAVALDVLSAGNNPATLAFGPAGTGNTSAPIITDIDGDSNDDMLVTFDAFDAGIACGDTELEVTGNKVSGIPVEAVDSIVTEDCNTGCHP